MNHQELYDTLLDATREDVHRGVVALIGSPGTGKTRFCYDYGKRRDLPVIVINPQLDLEEEIGGYLLKNPAKHEVAYSLPPVLTTPAKRLGINIEKDPFLVLVDELDKARESVTSCFCSFFSDIERRIRHYVLPKGALIVAAMNQPKRPLPEAITDRLLFVPFPPVDFKPNLGLQFRELYTKVSRKADAALLPERPVGSLRPLVALEAWTSHPMFWEEEALRETVVRGLFNPQQVPMVMEHISLAAPLQNHVRWSEIATPQSIVTHLIERLTAATTEEKVNMLKILTKRADDDKTSEISRVVDAFLQCEDAVDCVRCEPEKRKIGQAAYETAIRGTSAP